LHPSDLDDTLPTVDCELSDYLNFDEIEPEILAKQIAQSAARQTNETQMSGGGNAGGGGGEKATTNECGEGPGNGCWYKVYVQRHTSEAQGQATALGGPVWPDKCGGPCNCFGGCPSCHGPVWTECTTHSSAHGAKVFASFMNSGNKALTEYWECGETNVVVAYARNGEASASWECEDVADVELLGTDEGFPTAQIGEAIETQNSES
jgi:L-rhamnose mutarotase